MGSGQHPDGQQVVCISQVLSLFGQRGCVPVADVTGANVTDGVIGADVTGAGVTAGDATGEGVTVAGRLHHHL